MRRFSTVVLSALALTTLGPITVSAQAPVSISAELGFRSKYLFAGIPFAAEQVTHATLTAATSGFTVNGFGVFDHDASDVTEADVYADYYIQAAPALGVYVGGAYYNFKFATGWEGTPELYGGIVLTAPLTPTIHVAHDFDLGDGTHVVGTLSQSVPVGSGGVALDLTGNLAYNAEYYVAESGFAFADFGVGVSIPWGPLTIRPSAVVQRRLEDAFSGVIPDEEVFAVTAAATF